MAKVEGRESDALRGIASVSIAGELESRLRDLERNIAVAKQFIKLADDSYSEVRREWNILQQDISERTLGERKPESDLIGFPASPEKKTAERARRKESPKKEKTTAHSDEALGKDSQILTKIDSGSNRTKVSVPLRKDTEEVLHNVDASNPKRTLRRLHPRPKG